ncbi:hypothetical protein KIN20_031944 [Parelaphostrongylus tenuis]|uniref:RNA helicase n=1 Tax=Parelaphostrongylus tenuis TaxID=148309 RepID=A0AAD5R5W8_PARTN|nr:hypothetical protein KIN20_031944 [Parelaphostrongylus tenuis]
MQRDTQPRRRIQRNDEGPAMYRESTSQPRSRQSEELSRGSHMYPPTDGSNRNDHAQHEVVSGGIHYCDDQYDDQELRNNYYFDEDKASRQWDYLSVRRALSRMKMSSETAVSSHRSPAVNQSRFIGLPRGFTIQTNLDFLVPELAKNVLSFSRLRCIQEYMIPLVLYEYSFLAMGRNGSGRTCGYLIPLMHKLVEHKEIEMPGRCGPAALIVTCSQEKLKHVNHLRNKYSHGTRLQWCIVTKEKPDDEVVRINF